MSREFQFGVKSPFRTHPAYLQGFAEGMRDRSPVPAENAAPVEAPSTDHSKDVCVLCGKDRSAHTGLGCPDYSVTEVKYNGPVFDATWRAACRIEPVTRATVDDMIKKHYIGKWPGVCVLILALLRGSEKLGVIVFALPPRETSKRYGGETWELARLWLHDSVPQNAETFLIGKAIKYIRRHHTQVRILVSYADPSAGHAGTIYKAANWVADGRTDQERKTPRFDYADAVTGKKYSRRGHVPPDTEIKRVPRVSKHRFFYRLPEHK
jgi:hypothetical protein